MMMMMLIYTTGLIQGRACSCDVGVVILVDDDIIRGHHGSIITFFLCLEKEYRIQMMTSVTEEEDVITINTATTSSVVVSVELLVLIVCLPEVLLQIIASSPRVIKAPVWPPPGSPCALLDGNHQNVPFNNREGRVHVVTY